MCFVVHGSNEVAPANKGRGPDRGCTVSGPLTKTETAPLGPLGHCSNHARPLTERNLDLGQVRTVGPKYQRHGVVCTACGKRGADQAGSWAGEDGDGVNAPV
jgi:hypothetical protein